MWEIFLQGHIVSTCGDFRSSKSKAIKQSILYLCYYSAQWDILQFIGFFLFGLRKQKKQTVEKFNFHSWGFKQIQSVRWVMKKKNFGFIYASLICSFWWFPTCPPNSSYRSCSLAAATIFWMYHYCWESCGANGICVLWMANVPDHRPWSFTSSYR